MRVGIQLKIKLSPSAWVILCSYTFQNEFSDKDSVHMKGAYICHNVLGKYIILSNKRGIKYEHVI